MSQLKLIRDLIADDSYASTFQTMGQYRTGLLKNADALVRTEPSPSLSSGVTAQQYLGWVLQEGSATERAVAQTALHLLWRAAS